MAIDREAAGMLIDNVGLPTVIVGSIEGDQLPTRDDR